MDGIDKSQDPTSPDVTKDVVHSPGHGQRLAPTAPAFPSKPSSTPNLGNCQLMTKRIKTEEQEHISRKRRAVNKASVEIKGTARPGKGSQSSEQENSMFLPDTTSSGSILQDSSALECALLNRAPELKTMLQMILTKSSTTPPAPAGSGAVKKATRRRLVEPYNDQQEKVGSNFAPDKPSFGNAEEMLEVIVQWVLDAIDEISIHFEGLDDDEIETFRLQLKKIIAPGRYLDHPLLVAVIGKAGAGKSTMMNNLLNESGAAATGNGDKSCTNINTIYKHASMPLGTLYKADVELFDQALIDKMMEGCVDKILELKHYSGADKDDFEFDELGKEQDAALRVLATLIAGPASSSGFESYSDLECYMTKDPKVREQDIKPHIRRGVHAYLASCGITAGRLVFEAASLDKLNDKIRVYSGSVAGQAHTRSLWPLVEQIAVYLPSLIVERDVRLMDVPGFLDTNTFRKETSHQAYKDCNTALIVHPLERATDDVYLTDKLTECICDKKPMIVALTGLDNLKNEAIVSDEEKMHQNIKPHYDEKEAISAEIKALQAIDDERDLTEDEVKQLSGYKGEVKALSNRIYLERVLLRKEQAIDGVRRVHDSVCLRKYGTVKRWLPIFCVANTEYHKFMMGYDPRVENYDPQTVPRLPLQATGIPELRGEIRSAPAAKMLEKLQAAGGKEIDRLLIAIQLFCISSKLERKRDLMKLIIDPKKECAKRIQDMALELLEYTTKALKTLANHKSVSWKRKADRMLASLADYQCNSLVAFCKKSGVHVKMNKVKREKENINWNEIICNIYRAQFDEVFRKAFIAVQGMQTKLSLEISGLMNGIIEDMEEAESTLSLQSDLELFYEDIDYLRNEAITCLTDAFNDLEAEMRVIRSHATRTFVHDPNESYLLVSMNETYESAAGVKGPGSKNRILGMMEQKLNGPENIFQLVIDQSITAFSQYIGGSGWSVTTQANVCQKFKDVENKFHEGYLYEDKPESEARREFRKLMQIPVKQARDAVKGLLATEIKKIED